MLPGAASCCQLPKWCGISKGDNWRCLAGNEESPFVTTPRFAMAWHDRRPGQRRRLRAVHDTARNDVERLATYTDNTADAPTFMVVYAVAVVWAHEYSVPTDWNPVIATKNMVAATRVTTPSHRSQSVTVRHPSVLRPQGRVGHWYSVQQSGPACRY